MVVAWSTIIFLGYVVQLTVSEERVCSSFCSSLGTETNPGKSCADIYQINKASRGVSGDYWIQTATGLHQVYCDMELECGGYKGGWMRIADFDTSAGDDCPTGWVKITTPDDPPYPAIPVCRSPHNAGNCYPTTFNVSGANYYKICGKVRGYQKGGMDGFYQSTTARVRDLDGLYADGVSITIGNPRKHVWSYIGGQTRDAANSHCCNCPCSSTPGPAVPIYLLNQYYCDSGNDGTYNTATYFTNNPLWDGEGCDHPQNNCCADVGMPWFKRVFATAQKEDVEVRICHNEPFTEEESLVEAIQLYVQ